MKTTILLIVATLLPVQSHAAWKSCAGLYVADVWVQGEREDNSFWANKLVLTFKDVNGASVNCEGKPYAYIDNTSAAYNGMLSIAMAAYMADKEVKVAVNTATGSGDSNQLSYIKLVNN